MEKLVNPGCNVFISANAGSGKTKVLVDRFVALLLDGVEISKILCVTYTTSAADDMRARIVARLMTLLRDFRSKSGDFSQNSNPEYEAMISSALLNINRVKIQTFHAFCTDIIRNCPDELLNVPRDFAILDSDTAKKFTHHLKEKITRELGDLDHFSGDIRKSCETLLSEYGKHNFTELIGNIADKIYYFSRIVEKEDAYFEILNVGMSPEKLAHENPNTALAMDANFCNILQVLLENTKIGGRIEQHAKTLATWLEMDLQTRQKNIPQLFKAIFTADSLRADFKKTLVSMGKIGEFSGIIEKFYTNHSYFLTRHVINFAKYVNQEYIRLKNSVNSLDYSDLIHIVHKKIHTKGSDDFLMSVYGIFDHILLDEAQDMNDEQWEIVDLIFHEYVLNYQHICKTIFVVGDEKQSIYGFNASSVTSFVQRMKKYPDICRENAVPSYETTLQKSYRSREEILHYVDEFCNSSDCENLQNAQHIATRGQGGEVKIIEKTKEDAANLPGVVCEKLQEIIARGFSYSDVSILVSKRSSCKQFYSNFTVKTREYSIPVCADRVIDNTFGYCFFDLVNLIGFSCGLLCDYDISGFLKCPIFENIEGKQEILDFIASAGESSRFLSEFFCKISGNKHNIMQKLHSKYGDLLHIALDKIFNICGEFRDIYQAYIKLQFIEDLDSNVRYDGVNLMTIHGSKGLENKVVFVINSASDRRRADGYFIFTNPNFNIFISLSRSFAQFGKFLEAQGGESLIFNIKQQNIQFEWGERQRLQYVAITRPRELLYVYNIT